MRLHYYKPGKGVSNFGDELNKDIWEHFLPDFFDENEEEVFFGIGTILRAAKKEYPNSKILVFGSGAHAESQRKEPNFEVNFVRGPLSAKAMGLSDSQFITDPAILAPIALPVSHVEKRYKFSYMPHFSVANENYKKLFEDLGVHYIDPRDPISSILERINASEVVLTEAMHGAIVADAYRVPWLPMASYVSFNRFKWNDWSQSLNLLIKIDQLPRFYENEKGLKLFIKKMKARYQIKKTMQRIPYLSDSKIAEMARDKILERIEKLKTEH